MEAFVRLILVTFLGQYVLCEDLNQSRNSNSSSSMLSDIKDSTSQISQLSMTLTSTKDLTPKQRLRKELLKNYDKSTHPVEDHNQTIQVQLGMALIHIDLDEKRSLVTIDAWMRMAWNDSNLVWDPSKYDNVQQMHFDANELWKPDILLYNNADEANVNHYGHTNIIVENNKTAGTHGEVLWVPPGHFKAYCRLSLRLWPFDTQECTLKFGSWTSHGNQIDLALHRNSTFVENLSVYTRNREWKIVDKPTAKRNVAYYQCCAEPYPDIEFTFKLQRDSPSYRAIIVLPCLVIMLMTGCSFLLSPTAGEKLIINCFAVLCAILYLLYFANTLPFNQNEVPIIVTFYSNITALVGIAILLNVVCIGMARERKYSSPPKFLKNIFAGYLGRLLCLGNYAHQVSSTHHRLVVELEELAESDQTNNQNHVESQEESGHDMRRSLNAPPTDSTSIIMRDWILVAAGLERLFFSVYAMAFAIITSVYV